MEREWNKETYTVRRVCAKSTMGGLTDEMVLEILHHAESAETLHADHFEQSVVADGVLLVLRIVQVALFNYRPDLLHDLVSSHRVLANKSGQFRGQGHRLCVAFAATSFSSLKNKRILT